MEDGEYLVKMSKWISVDGELARWSNFTKRTKGD